MANEVWKSEHSFVNSCCHVPCIKSNAGHLCIFSFLSCTGALLNLVFLITTISYLLTAWTNSENDSRQDKYEEHDKWQLSESFCLLLSKVTIIRSNGFCEFAIKKTGNDPKECKDEIGEQEIRNNYQAFIEDRKRAVGEVERDKLVNVTAN